MKVLLLSSIPKIGQKGELITVSDGYAKNALFPKKLAVAATPGMIHDWEEKKQKEAIQKEERKEIIKKIIPEIQKHIFAFTVKTGKTSEVFTSIHQEEIQNALAQFLMAQSKLLGNEDIHLELKPIKELGDHEIQIRIGREEHIQKTYTHIQINAEK